MEKDYSLLRPFDLEAANFGTKAYWFETECVWFGPSGNKFSQPMYAVEHNAGMSYVPASELRAYPLAWVEGRPVYKGDVLYCEKLAEHTGIAVQYFQTGMIHGLGQIYSDLLVAHPEHMTWQKPKTKREGWIEVCQVRHHKSKEDAERNRTVGGQVMFAQWEE